jgi:hypothetical protein
LGECYKTGKGFEKNLQEAFKLYKMAAEKGEIHSQLNLAICYYNGTGTTRDPDLAFKWHQCAADKGCGTSQYNLALHYQSGYGTTRDLIKSYELFQKSSAQGNLSAKREIARCFFRGEGVPQDTEEGVKIIKSVLIQDGLQLRHAVDFHDNMDVVNIAVKQNGAALEFVPFESRNSRSLCLMAVKQNMSSWEWIPGDLQMDIDIYMIAHHMHVKLKPTNQYYQDVVFVFTEQNRELYYEKLRKIVSFLEYLRSFRRDFLDRSETLVSDLNEITEDIQIDDERIDLIMQQMKTLMELLGNDQQLFKMK